MASATLTSRLDRAIDASRDHILGSPDAELTLVEYGSYACPYCRAANEEIAAVRDQFGDRLRYVFRHRPLTGSEIARRAAELVEQVNDPEQFWRAHIALMTRSETLTEDDLTAVVSNLGLAGEAPEAKENATEQAQLRVKEDEASAQASGVKVTPTFFINGRRYDGPWDQLSLSGALRDRLGHRVSAATLDFVNWGPSAGFLLFLATLVAVAIANSPFGAGFEDFWQKLLGISLGASSFSLSLRHWINDGLLTIFFLVVGLEIKREFTVGHLASQKAAALPVAAAIGGMVLPTLIYILFIPSGLWAHGWGVPMATDTAFAVALIIVLGDRVPVSLRIFLTAAAIVDDIGAILVVALFYAGDLDYDFLGVAALFISGLALLNRAHVYRVSPYIIIGSGLWIAVHESGLHATLAGVILALFIPTRAPPNFVTLATQANTILKMESARGEEVLRHGPSLPALRAIDAIHDRLESPGDRLLRYAGARSSYIVLPLFALANAGVAWSPDVLAGHETLLIAIMLAMVIGKPLGLLLASLLAVRLRLAVKPASYSWRQLVGAGALAGIGFTMSLFIASEAFPGQSDFAAAKIAVLSGSVLSALFGVALLLSAEIPAEDERQDSEDEERLMKRLTT